MNRLFPRFLSRLRPLLFPLFRTPSLRAVVCVGTALGALHWSSVSTHAWWPFSSVHQEAVQRVVQDTKARVEPVKDYATQFVKWGGSKEHATLILSAAINAESQKAFERVFNEISPNATFEELKKLYAAEVKVLTGTIEGELNAKQFIASLPEGSLHEDCTPPFLENVVVAIADMDVQRFQRTLELRKDGKNEKEILEIVTDEPKEKMLKKIFDTARIPPVALDAAILHYQTASPEFRATLVKLQDTTTLRLFKLEAKFAGESIESFMFKHKVNQLIREFKAQGLSEDSIRSMLGENTDAIKQLVQEYIEKNSI